MPFILYVHPNAGPISPVEIDLAAVEDAGAAAPGRSTQAMALYVATQVDRRYSKARARENVRAFEAIVPHMNPHFGTYITGIAVRVPGEIPATMEKETGKKLAELEQAVTSLKVMVADETKKLLAEQEAHQKTYKELVDLRNHGARGVSHELVERLQKRCAELEADLKRATVAAQEQVRIAGEAAQQAERERGQEQVRAEKAERDREAAVAKGDALVKERDDLKSKLNRQENTWRNDKRAYEERIQELKRELEILRRQQSAGVPETMEPRPQSTRVRVTLPVELGRP